MQITGTKKLIIILLSTVCAFAAGLGVLFGGGVGAQAEKADGGTVSSVTDEKVDGHSATDKLYAEIENAGNADGISDTQNQQSDERETEDTAESEYDERYDEGVIFEIAERLNVDVKLINMYLRVKGIDARDILAQLEEDKDTVENTPEYEVQVVEPGEEAEEQEQEPLNGNIILEEIDEFKNEYEAGAISLDEEAEDEDWYVAPDEIGEYATFTYIAYNNTTYLGSMWYQKTLSFTKYAVNVVRSRTPYQFAWRATVTLAPGETFEFRQTRTNRVRQNCFHSYSGNDHWKSVLNWADPISYNNSVYVIDGDAPTGTMFRVRKYGTDNVNSGDHYYHYYSASLSNGGSSTNGAYAAYSYRDMCYEITVIRQDPPKPTIVNESGVTGNRKDVTFDGGMASISMRPDFGASLLRYELDDDTELMARSQHGNEGTGGATITFGSKVAGEHRIRLLPPESTNRWSDGSSTPVDFVLNVQLRTTSQPVLQREAGVATNGKSKTVHDNGDYQTITFLGVDKNFVNWTSNGLVLQSWGDDGTLVLKQREQGTYTINLFLTNPAGCSWVGGSTDILQFSFIIAEMYIDKPVMADSPGSTTKTVDYTGEAQSLTVSPAIMNQLVIVTAGVSTNATDADGDGVNDSVEFSMTDSATVTIIISPENGYVWRDGTKTQIVFTFTINAVYVDAPRLALEEGVSGNRKTITFNPTSGWYGTLKIINIPQEAIAITTALTTDSWEDGELVLKASNALVYKVTFALTSINYQWAPGTVVPTFYLQINRYALQLPHIIYDNDENKIEGDTKTVHFSDPAEDKFFKLYMGGFTRNNQILLDYLINIDGRSLTEVWGTDEPVLTLRGEHAANYIINITPTSNYCWNDGDPDSLQATRMVSFKFVINAIQKDIVPMYSNINGAWVPAPTRESFADYDGYAKKFRIGAEDRDTQKFSNKDMNYFIVDQSFNIVTSSELVCTLGPNGDPNYLGLLEFEAVNAGTYIVMVQLRDTDYAWRDGSGVNVYYTFTIRAKPVDAPVILPEECGGYELNVQRDYIYGIYDGNFFTLGINVKSANYIMVLLDPNNEDNDPDMPGGKGIWQYSRSQDDSNSDYDRLVLRALNQGTHICRLMIDPENPNFRWADDVPFYEFKIIIDFAIVSGVTFYYENDGEIREIGESGSMYTDATFITDDVQNIIVRRSDESTFTNTPFESQFTYKITATNGYVEDKDGLIVPVDGNSVYGKSQLSLGFYHADTYTVQVYLTKNYRWEAKNMSQTAPYWCMFQIRPKQLALPEISPEVDMIEEDGDLINGHSRTKTVTYNRTQRKLALDLGDDYKAFEVTNTSEWIKHDPDNDNPHLMIYQARDAGEHKVYITLSNNNNYQWSMGPGVSVEYTLNIQPRAVDLPLAYLIDSQTVKDWGETVNSITQDIAETTDGAVLLTENSLPQPMYTKNPYRVYLYGEAVINSDVDISIVPQNASNAGITEKGDVTIQAQRQGAWVSAINANTYAVTIKFNLNPAGTPNCTWADTGFSTARELKFEILKMVVDVPVIEGYEDQELENDSHYAYFTYDNASHSINVLNCLSGEYMQYDWDRTRTDAEYVPDSGSAAFRTVSVANVGIDYILTVLLDEPNQRWNIDGEADNTSPKKYHIVMQKAGVEKPVILQDDPDAEYDDVSKTVLYDGSNRIDELTIQGLTSEWMTYKLASSLTMQSVYNDSTLIVSTDSQADKYSVVISLRDPTNMKWMGTEDDSDDLDLSLIVKPSPVFKPVVDSDNCTGNYKDIDDPFPDDYTMVVTYDGNFQYIAIENYLYHDVNNLMRSTTISSSKFASSDFDEDKALLIFGAKNVGEYTVQITLSQNAEWEDGTGNVPVNITLRIEKVKYDTPVIYDNGNADEVVTQFGKTVTYVLKTEQVIEIVNYNADIMSLWATSSSVTGKELVNKGIDETTGYYVFGATDAGTYSVTFRLKDFTNERWDYADNETITFTFVINKLSIAAPTFESAYNLSQDSITANAFTATYDSRNRTAIVNNVLGVDYMTFEPAENYNSSGTTRFVYDSVALASSYNAAEGRNSTVEELLGYTDKHVFDNSAITLADEIDKQNFITMKATRTGAYTVNFDLTDPANVQWDDGSVTQKPLTLNIRKMQCAAPSVDGSNTANYTGKYIEFKVKDAFNGRETQDDFDNNIISTFEYEIHTIGAAVSPVQGAQMELVSWFGGNMVLRALEVGTYSVTISIRDRDTTEWTNTTATTRTLTFTIEKSAVTPVITYTSADSSFVAGSNRWTISTPVIANIAFNNVCVREDGRLDLGFAVEANFVKRTAPDIKYTPTVANPPSDLAVPPADMAAGVPVVSTVNPKWSLVKNADGSYSLIFAYSILYGTDNITKGTFSMNIDQNGDSGNYTIKQARSEFNIIADRAPFDESTLIWQYRIDNDPDGKVNTLTLADFGLTDWKQNSNRDNPLELDYLTDGGAYIFNIFMNDDGMAGHDGAGYERFDAALLSWEVKWDGVYGGRQSAMYAGTYSVSIRISAKDADYYSFDDTTYTLWFKIKPVLYDLSGLSWDYSGTPFTFDNTAKSVKLIGSLPSGLTVSTYLVTDYDLNTQTYAGHYKTALTFTTSNANYQLPVMGDDTTYICPDGFPWEIEWDIEKADLEVKWRKTQSSDGSSLAYVPMLAEHGEKVNYIFYRWAGIEGWVETDNFAHNEETQFKVVVELKSNPVNPATDYANNYVLKFVEEDDPDLLETVFTLGGDVNYIAINVDVNSEKSTDADGNIVYEGGRLASGNDPENIINKFGYTGKPFEAVMSIFSEPSGEITLDNIILTYYSSVNYNKPLAGAPVNAGKYKVKLTLINIPENGIEYALSDREFYFAIELGTFDSEKIYWQYSHTDDKGNITRAKYDFDSSKWVQSYYWNEADQKEVTDNYGSEVTFTYDGLGHTVELVSEDDRLVIRTKNKANINAGSYTSTATFSYDGTKWNAPEIANVMDWVIEKAEISLAAISWNYTGDFVYKLSGGKAVEYSVTLNDLHPYLLDFISYSTTKDGVSVNNRVSDAGTYVTTATISDLPETSNYTLGEWPSHVDKSYEWQIAQKEIPVPEAVFPGTTGYWKVFDGLPHDLLAAITKDIDWEEYYSISIRYAVTGSTSSNAFEGYQGYKYSAFDAGTYTYTFTINSALNRTNTNVVWQYTDESVTPPVTATTTSDRTYNLVIDRAAMHVVRWNEDLEKSTVELTGDYVSDKFIDYRFYEGTDNTGNIVGLDRVVASEGKEFFTIEPFVKAEYGNNIMLTFEPSVPTLEYYTFETPELSTKLEDQQIVPKNIFVAGYRTDGVYHEFTRDEWKEMLKDVVAVTDSTTEEEWDALLTPENKAKAKVYMTYSGKPVTFVLNLWDSYYVNHLDVWGGNLTQSEAGAYSVTLIFKKDSAHPRCWSATDNGDGTYTYDRSPLTLNFQLRYLMLTLPELTDVTYTGAETDIIQNSLGDEAYDKLLTEYGDYVTITGNTATVAGSYRVYLTIKDEYLNTIRWDNGTDFGQPGTYIINWNILPIYIERPNTNASTVVYDGQEHSVFEKLVGYNPDGAMSEGLQGLMQNARISSEGSRGINAGTYSATFSLPDANYAWIDGVTGNVDSSVASISVKWEITKKPLDLSGVYWGYRDVNGEYQRYDEANGIYYTYSNGEPFVYSLQLCGIPEELEDFISYIIGEDSGNSKSEIGTYKMLVFFFTREVDRDNYNLGSLPLDFQQQYSGTDSDLELEWKIVPRQYVLNGDKEVYYTGEVRDILEILGIGEGWENYLDVTVEYKAYGSNEFIEYMEVAEIDELLGYSIYNVYYVGEYRINLFIKQGINTADLNKVIFLVGGNALTLDQQILLTVNPFTVEVESWNDNYQYSTVEAQMPEDLPDETRAMFEYVIQDYESGEIVTAEQVEERGSGYSYTITYRVKPEYEYAAKTGIIIDFDTNGVSNPYLFGIYNFVYDKVVWIPIPVLDVTSQVFTNGELDFNIQGWAEDYVISDAFKAMYPNYEYDRDTFIYAIGNNADMLDLSSGTIKAVTVDGEGNAKAVKAGEYNLTLRFAPGINLSWYDATRYSVNSSGNLVERATNTVITNTTSLVNRYAQTVTFTVEKASVEQIDVERFQAMMPTLEYNGTTYNLKELAQCSPMFAELERLYGNLITFEGYEHGESGAHDFIISLADPESSFWNLEETVYENVREEGYEFRWMLVNGAWRIRYVHENEDGSLTEFNGGNYTTEKVEYLYVNVIDGYELVTEGDDSQLNEDGTPKTENVYEVGEDGVAVRYNLLQDGTYERDPEGQYIARYKHDADGNIVTAPAIDEHFNLVIDNENSFATISYVKQSTDPYKLTWHISASTRTAPYVDLSKQLVYNGSEQSVTDMLANFDPLIMEVVEGGTATDAGEYTAKIVLKGDNYTWADTDLDYVLVTWHIEKANVDLTGVTWDYDENSKFVFSIDENGDPVVHSVSLLNLPDSVKSSIKYITNGVEGAHAGTNAGRYLTSFEITNLDANFGEVIIPDGLQTTISWNIEKLALKIPATVGEWRVFDDEPHDLLELITLPENWERYIDITITYSDGGSSFTDYGGYEGDPYKAYGSGLYRFYISLKAGVNTSASNPNVVWIKQTADIPVI